MRDILKIKDHTQMTQEISILMEISSLIRDKVHKNNVIAIILDNYLMGWLVGHSKTTNREGR